MSGSDILSRWGAVLATSTVFGGLTPAELERLLSHTQVHSLLGGQFLFREGDPGNGMFLVCEGQVLLSRRSPTGRGVLLGWLRVGEVLGEMALLDDSRRSASASVIEAATVLELARDSFESLVAQDDPLALVLLERLSRLLCGRLRAVADRIEWEMGAGAGGPPGRPASHAFRQTPYSSELLTTGKIHLPFPEGPGDLPPVDPSERDASMRVTVPLFRPGPHAAQQTSDFLGAEADQGERQGDGPSSGTGDASAAPGVGGKSSGGRAAADADSSETAYRMVRRSDRIDPSEPGTRQRRLLQTLWGVREDAP